MSGGKGKINILGNRRSKEDCQFISTSTCIVMRREDDEPVDSSISNGMGLNEYLYYLEKEIRGLRRQVRQLQAEKKV